MPIGVELTVAPIGVVSVLDTATVASIKQTEFVELLQGLSHSTFISLAAVTDPDMRKRNNPFCSRDGRSWIPHVRKVSILSGAMINVSYSNMVNTRRLQEFADTYDGSAPEKARTHPRAWGENVKDSPLVQHSVDGDERLYLHVAVQHRNDLFFDDRTGKKLTVAELGTLDEWLNERDSGYRSQGLKRPVIVKDFKLTNVAELTANQQRFAVTPAVTELTRYLPKTKPTVARPRRRVSPSSRKKRQPAKGVTV